ncbi:MAG: hypothetical protein GF388_09255 [Candidatus Aegiribacteria sp.]|nr:hypothetical protein [Candidatus Aegiribacteria sp.]MBD3295244.1 hypothetical protein [Candidatus Fermentibacteria bacterium]
MKLYNCDWNIILQVCHEWNTLTLEDRREFHRVARDYSASSFPVDDLSENTGSSLVSIGLLEALETKPGLLKLSDTGNHMRRFLKDLMQVRSPVADPEDEERMTEYVHSLLSMNERIELLNTPRAPRMKSRTLSRQLAKRASSPSWVLSFMRGERTSEDRKGRMFDTAKKIISLISSAEGIAALDELAGCFAGSERAFLASVLSKSVASLLVYPALAVDYRILICLHQNVLNELHRESSEPPESFSMQGLKTFTPLLDDMVVLLVEASSSPIRIRQKDGAVYVRTMKTLMKALHPYGEFYDGLLESNRRERINLARMALSRMRYVEEWGLEEGGLVLKPSDSGKKWLAMSRKGRLKTVLNWIREYMTGQYDESGRYRSRYYKISTFPDYSPRVYTKTYRSLDLKKEILACFTLLDRLDCVWTDELFKYFSGEAAALKVRLNEEYEAVYLKDQLYIGEELSDREFNRQWLSSLHDFFTNVMLMLGCLGSKFCEDERLAVRLTDAGRFLFGLRDDFKLEDEERTSVVIQPDFSVVFMAPSPAAESLIAPLSERIGRGVGELFRITAENVLKVASSGITADKIIADLEEISVSSLPENVRRQIQDWCGQCRKVISESAILIRCPDAETALRVKAQGMKSVEQLSDTVLTVPDHRALRKLRTKLREKGITFD